MCEPAYHIPVLLDESVNGLNIKPSGIYVDVTFGGGGHSKEILSRLNGKGRLFSFDQDADAEKNIEASEGFTFVRSNFRYLKNWMRYYGVEKIDGLLADLGVSSHHFDDESRGFSFRFDAPLDMRMNKRAGKTAADVVNEYDEERLADIFFLYGEMKNSRKIASMLVRARQKNPIQTTLDLITAVRGQQTPTNTMAESREKKDMAKLFQALRIEVNHEMDALKEMLLSATELLKPGGRLSVITYHSLEDRMVKNIIRAGNAEGKVETDVFGRSDAPLEAVKLCDWVTIHYAQLGIHVKRKVTKTVYNVLKQRYDSIELGGVATVADTIVGMQSALSDSGGESVLKVNGTPVISLGLPNGTYTDQTIYACGTLTSGGNSILFTIPLPGALNRGCTVTPSGITVRDRGNYLAQNLTTGVTYTYTPGAAGITVTATKSDGWGGVNNSAVAVAFAFSLSLT